MSYKIEVIMTPNTADSPEAPYFWIIKSCAQNGDWCTTTAGWTVTPEEAWKEAKTFYNKYLNERKD